MNNKSTKIVVIGSFLKESDKSIWYPKTDSDEYYVNSWGALFARRLKFRYPDIDIEVWRPDDEFTEIYHRNALGVDCTIYPYRWHLFSRTITFGILWQLLKYQHMYNLVIYINTIFDWKSNILLPFILLKAKFVLSHHGGVFPEEKYIKNMLKKKILLFSYNNINVLTYLREAIRKEIESKNKHIKLSFLPVGANFDVFTPLNKNSCRTKLNLPIDKTIAVYVGAFYKLKGVDNILNVIQQLKLKNFEVLFVGGQQTDELYADVIKCGSRFWGNVNQSLLREIYSASDFYIHPAFHPEFGGIDVAWMEALACNIPVLSPLFNELDFDYSEMGIILNNLNELTEKTKIMIKTFSSFNKCRETAIKHLDGNTVIIDKLYNILCK